eukprot:226308_1
MGASAAPSRMTWSVPLNHSWRTRPTMVPVGMVIVLGGWTISSLNAVAWPAQGIFWLDDTDRQNRSSRSTFDPQSQLRLDGIICCVDAKYIEMQLYESRSVGETAQQIAFADHILLNNSGGNFTGVAVEAAIS